MVLAQSINQVVPPSDYNIIKLQVQLSKIHMNRYIETTLDTPSFSSPIALIVV